MTVGRGDGGLCWRAVVGSDVVLRERGRAALVGGVLVRVLLLWEVTHSATERRSLAEFEREEARDALEAKTHAHWRTHDSTIVVVLVEEK